jgi:hypothetical protein
MTAVRRLLTYSHSIRPIVSYDGSRIRDVIYSRHITATLRWSVRVILKLILDAKINLYEVWVLMAVLLQDAGLLLCDAVRQLGLDSPLRRPIPEDLNPGP